MTKWSMIQKAYSKNDVYKPYIGSYYIANIHICRVFGFFHLIMEKEVQERQWNSQKILKVII